MWGQGQEEKHMKNYRRIIPTRVGTRRNLEYKHCTSQDHPHACGDKSSLSVEGVANNGIIPTRVGTRG